MSWSKIKNIILLILLLLNLFLLGLVGLNRVHARHYENSALEQTVRLLKREGIAVDWNGLPASSTLSPIQVARDTEAEEKFAVVLLGEGTQMTASGGGLYVYESDAGSVSFRGGGDFSALFSRPIALAESRDKQVKSLLSALDLRGELQEDGEKLTVVQLLGGVPVYSGGASAPARTGAVFTYDQTGLLSVSGRLMLGSVQADPQGKDTLSLPTALMSFYHFLLDSGDVCRLIHSLAPVYLTGAASEPSRLSPGWKLTTDAGEYYLDAVTGEVLRSSEGR